MNGTMKNPNHDKDRAKAEGTNTGLIEIHGIYDVTPERTGFDFEVLENGVKGTRAGSGFKSTRALKKDMEWEFE
jgi:hypothetical protein